MFGALTKASDGAYVNSGGTIFELQVVVEAEGLFWVRVYRQVWGR